MKQLNAIITIAYRDFVKFLRDRTRLIATFIFPVIFIGILGGSLQANLGNALGYNFLLFTFIGVLGQTLFQNILLFWVKFWGNRWSRWRRSLALFFSGLLSSCPFLSRV